MSRQSTELACGVQCVPRPNRCNIDLVHYGKVIHSIKLTGAVLMGESVGCMSLAATFISLQIRVGDN